MIDNNNSSDICAPITLLGAGRCGTSVIQALALQSRALRVVGETAPLIFDTFENIAIAANNTDIERGGDTSINLFIAKHIRQLFNRMYNLEGLRWFQKPIGLPKYYEFMLTAGAPINIISDRYWAILRTIFPHAKIAISLRDPIDNILSISRYMNISVTKATVYLCYMLAILSKADINSVKIVDFRRLSTDTHATISELSHFWELDLSVNLQDMLSIHYAKTPGEAIGDSTTNHNIVTDYSDKRNTLNTAELLPYLALCYRFCDTLGVAFERPSYVWQYLQLSDECEKDPLCLPSFPPFLLDDIREENSFLYSKADGLERRVVNLLDQINELKRWIAELENGKGWLENKYNEQRQLLDTLRRLLG